MDPNGCPRLAPTRPNHKGQALVEFMLVVPILILIIVGVFDLGFGVYAYNVVSNSAREGARYGITKPDDPPGMTNQAISKSIGLDPSLITVVGPQCTDSNNNPSPCTFGNNLTITVRYNFRPVTLFFASFTVTGKSTMTIE